MGVKYAQRHYCVLSVPYFVRWNDAGRFGDFEIARAEGLEMNAQCTSDVVIALIPLIVGLTTLINIAIAYYQQKRIVQNVRSIFQNLKFEKYTED